MVLVLFHVRCTDGQKFHCIRPSCDFIDRSLPRLSFSDGPGLSFTPDSGRTAVHLSGTRFLSSPASRTWGFSLSAAQSEFFLPCASYPCPGKLISEKEIATNLLAFFSIFYSRPFLFFISIFHKDLVLDRFKYAIRW
ncbi:hypothetical protein HPP92_020122 [Vanilla planifolia]|uniref:Uncharacterized protein n=1 Tax=Vanilla planifolia TaxID=51239 RepID=A0A835Q726_VANPL|nr:hypothetical protein HPP92_020122 [Vanilla planifolia]